MISRRLWGQNLKNQVRNFSKNNGFLYEAFANLFRPDKGGNKTYPLETGATRYWELNNDSQFICIGASGPVNLEQVNREMNNKLRNLIDFRNLDDNKLHIDVIKCPRILKMQLMAAFPIRSIAREDMRIIKLSYDHYANQNKGKTESLFAANYICKRLQDRGYFSFYSGAGIKDADNEIFFHAPPRNLGYDEMKKLHVNISSMHDCWNIEPLADNDVGIIYMEGEHDRLSLKELIERD